MGGGAGRARARGARGCSGSCGCFGGAAFELAEALFLLPAFFLGFCFVAIGLVI